MVSEKGDVRGRVRGGSLGKGLTTSLLISPTPRISDK